MAYIVPMLFVETSSFTRQITGMVSDEVYAEFQQWLAAHPDAGDVIEGTGGLRKVRLGLPGRGKSGGARVIYYYFVADSKIIMLLAYPKNVQSTLTAEQKKALKAVIENWR